MNRSLPLAICGVCTAIGLFLSVYAEDNPLSGGSATPVNYTLQDVLAREWMSLEADGSFHAEHPVTRAQLATALVKAFQLEERPLKEAAAAPFKDVPSAHWAANAIQIAAQTGLMGGYRPQRFYPDHLITRAEGFAILGQAYGVFPFEDAQVTELLAPYQDANQIPAWAQKAIATALHEDLIEGAADAHHLFPQRKLTRGELGYALVALLNRQNASRPLTP